jgi:hypothetical protein
LRDFDGYNQGKKRNGWKNLQNQKPQRLSMRTVGSQFSVSHSSDASQPSTPPDRLHCEFSRQEHFVDAERLAKHLSVTRRQVLEMTRRGMIPARPLGIGTVRKVWRYKISEVEAAIARHICKPASSKDDSDLAASAAPTTMHVGSSRSQRGKLNG